MDTRQTRAVENLRDAVKRCLLVGIEPRGVAIPADRDNPPRVGLIAEHGGVPCHASIAILPLEDSTSSAHGARS